MWLCQLTLCNKKSIQKQDLQSGSLPHYFIKRRRLLKAPWCSFLTYFKISWKVCSGGFAILLRFWIVWQKRNIDGRQRLRLRHQQNRKVLHQLTQIGFGCIHPEKKVPKSSFFAAVVLLAPTFFKNCNIVCRFKSQTTFGCSLFFLSLNIATLAHSVDIYFSIFDKVWWKHFFISHDYFF